MAQVGERTHDAIIAPSPVFARHPDYQSLEFGTDPRTPGKSTMAGAVKLPGNQTPVPSQDGIRLGDLRDVFERFPSESFANLGERDSLWVRKP